tara:strand:- start:169 stop:402 length:234 start_codon:yes stop_codon:yes gene_type:complete
MKYLFVVDHFISFPRSEYGGMWNVVAATGEECFDLITDADDNFNFADYGKLRDNITKADKYALVDELESKVVSSFLT